MIPRTTILLCVGCMFAHSFNSYLWVVPIKKKKKEELGTGGSSCQLYYATS